MTDSEGCVWEVKIAGGQCMIRRDMKEGSG